MNKFAEEMVRIDDLKHTENGGVAYVSSGLGAVVDLFAVAGALRSRTVNDIEKKFKAAFEVDPLLTTRLLFYCGNIRGGLGERRTFRICLHWLAAHYPEIVVKNIHNIPHFNRWDSLFELIGTPAEEAMWHFIKVQLVGDLTNYNNHESISLLAKWLPSINASSIKTRTLAKRAIHELEFNSEKAYRKCLSMLRGYLNVVEHNITLGDWDKIDYEKLPSYAAKRYIRTFMRFDHDRYTSYVEKLKSGQKKINASTLYPYDIVTQVLRDSWNSTSVDVLNEQWKNLPNYITNPSNILVMADVSGSMTGRPMDTSIGLAIYFAERNMGEFHNLYMTFTDNPYFINLDCATKDNILSKVSYCRSHGIGYSTNLDKAFRLVYNTIIDNEIPQSDVPKAIVVISDMEIDAYSSPKSNWDFVQKWEDKFEKRGYTLPKLVFWNVEARNDTFLSHNKNVIYVSGQSVSVFKNLIGAIEGKTSIDIMLEVLMDEMYDRVII